MPTRRTLPHEPPRWVDPSCEVWFITICCQRSSGRDGTPRRPCKEHHSLSAHVTHPSTEDAAARRPYLTDPQIAPALLESIGWRVEQGHWWAWLFLLMPDHCHALLSFPAGRSWKRTVRDWKHWTAAQLGIAWQRDFFDHRLRRDESFSEKAQYISQNPVRAGFVARVEDWPHVWRPAEGEFTTLHR